jgi:PadR family transcriptional regulator PadR
MRQQHDDLPSLPRKEAIVLDLLLAGKELYGLEMVEASGGDLKRGTIYVTLQRMEEKGFITSRRESRVSPEIGIPRRLYAITGLGRRAQAAAGAARAVLIPQFS